MRLKARRSARGSTTTGRRASIALAATAAMLLLFGAASAQAAYTTGTPLSTGKLTTGVTVDQSNGDVYAASPGGATSLLTTGGVKRFIEGGAGGEEECSGYPEHPYAVAVGTGAGLYVAEVSPFTISEPHMHLFATGCGAESGATFPLLPSMAGKSYTEMGTDSSGNLYYPAAPIGGGEVKKYEPSGAEVTTGGFPIEGLTRPSSASVDSSGNVYVAESQGTGTNENQLVGFSAAPNAPSGGTFTLTLAGETTTAIAYSTTGSTLRNNIKAALQALPMAGTGNVNLKATGGATVEFFGALAGVNVSQMSCDGSGLTGEGTPTCEVTTTQEGAPGPAGHVVKYDSAGSLLGTFASGEITTATVDASTGNVFVGYGVGGTQYPGAGFRVAEFDESGTQLAAFGHGTATTAENLTTLANHLAVDEGSGVVYASDAGGKVQVFEPEPEPFVVTATKSGSGNGWLHSQAPEYAINCGAPCTSKSSSFTGEAVLTASGAQFAGWEACPGAEAGRTCTLTEAGEAAAEFVANHPITVTKTGSGNGWVHSEAPAYTINCGGPCTSKTGFFEASTVELTASGAEFTEWVSCPEGVISGRTCTITSSSAEEAEVKFGA